MMMMMMMIIIIVVVVVVLLSYLVNYYFTNAKRIMGKLRPCLKSVLVFRHID